MKKRWYYTILAGLIISSFLHACKKDDNAAPTEVESPKPTANFEYALVDDKDPFTFKFDNLATNFKEVRWEFGDDSTTTEESPVHTFINTGTYQVRLVAKNEQGYWAQKEVKIRLTGDDVFSFSSTPAANGALTLLLSSPVTTSSITWYKGTGTTATLINSGPTATITVPPGTYENYSVRITTPKGSKAELIRMVGGGGVFRDITGLGVFTVSRDNDSGRESGEGSLKLIDNNLASKFLQFNYNGDFWTQLDYKDQPAIIGAYSLTSGNDAPERDPKNFKLEGSNDLSNWTTVDERVDEKFSGRGFTKTYLVDNKQAFRYYRLNVTEINGAGLIQIAEWRVLAIQ